MDVKSTLTVLDQANIQAQPGVTQDEEKQQHHRHSNVGDDDGEIKKSVKGQFSPEFIPLHRQGHHRAKDGRG